MNLRQSIRKIACLFSLLFIFTAPAIADTSVHYHFSGGYFGASGSGEAMVLDAVIIRPLSAVTTIAGSAIYTISLPFSLLGGNEQSAREKLVLEPARYTFKRPLGEFEY